MSNKLFRLIPAAVLAAAGIVFICTGNRHDTARVSADHTDDVITDSVTYADAAKADNGIWIYISGYVMNPGVYYLPYGSRMFEAVEMAGGLCEDAVTDSLNLAMVLEDGQHVSVPGPPGNEQDAALPAVSDNGLININTASADELKTLPGIGDTKASAIIEYRQHSAFIYIEDIMNVPGIKENSFEKIKDRITV